MVRCENVHKSYQLGDRRVEALRGLDLTIDRPGFYAVMGASGSGKSTLLHLLAALDAPDEGTIEISGTKLESLGEREADAFRARSIGIVFQQFNLLPTMTARENVELPGVLQGEDPHTLRDRAAQLLERLGVGERAEHRPQALSGGEQQRVAIARALLFQPKLILADEPTGALDSASSARLWALLRDVADEEGVTIVMVTHEPTAAAHCSRIFVISDGRVTGEIAPEHQQEQLDAASVAARYQRVVGTA
ncbi:MAG: ABC transporter ATP-binding protein [Planctomycetota bacterium]